MDVITLCLILLPVGYASGYLACICGCWLLSDSRSCGQTFGWYRRRWCRISALQCPACGEQDVRWPTAVACGSALLFPLFGWCLVAVGCQTVTEVRPAFPMWQQRLPFQLLLLFLLQITVITDLLDYSISDIVVFPGALVAVLLAAASGELQIIHVWVSWDAELVELYGPYLPEWMKQHQHLHGLAWSLAGLVTGAGVMWVTRILAGTILGYPAVGFGDVTLMAMIGAFIGWQPVLCTLAIAPVCGLMAGLLIRLVSGKNYVAFGPYLAAAAVIVLFTWRLLWEQLMLRNIFSHGPTVAGLVIGSLGGISLLLGGMRLFRSVPVAGLKR